MKIKAYYYSNDKILSNYIQLQQYNDWDQERIILTFSETEKKFKYRYVVFLEEKEIYNLNNNTLNYIGSLSKISYLTEEDGFNYWKEDNKITSFITLKIYEKQIFENDWICFTILNNFKIGEFSKNGFLYNVYCIGNNINITHMYAENDNESIFLTLKDIKKIELLNEFKEDYLKDILKFSDIKYGVF